MNNICVRIDILQRNSCFHRKEILRIEEDGVNCDGKGSSSDEMIKNV